MITFEGQENAIWLARELDKRKIIWQLQIKGDSAVKKQYTYSDSFQMQINPLISMNNSWKALYYPI